MPDVRIKVDQQDDCMTKRKLGCAAELAGAKGKKVAVSDWLTVSQNMIDDLADATYDHQSIYVDPEPAAHAMRYS